MTLYYDILFAVSICLSLAYAWIWHKHFDVHITLIYILVPVTNLGYTLLARAESLEAAAAANKLSYFGGCFELLIIMLSIFSLCGISLKRWMRIAFMALSMLVFLSTPMTGANGYFYKEMRFERIDDKVYLYKEYGIMHTVYYCMIVLYFLLSIGAMIYSLRKKKQVSRRMIYLLFLPVLVCMISFFVGRLLTNEIEFIPVGYVFAQVVYLIIVYRIHMYDVSDTAVDAMVEKGDTGFISFDDKFRYLASNQTARTIFPALNDLIVDASIEPNDSMRETALVWLKAYAEDPANHQVMYEHDDHSYVIEIADLYNRRHKCGYQFFITDDTKNQQYIRLLNQYNAGLENEVREKTAHIVMMHDRLILGMASMVESRDNSTGGHIRRTSECVRILIGEMRKVPSLHLTEEFCSRIIKAAPMHDLGKIAVDDAVLRKPGRFTDEEYEKMKAHAAEGARIVHEILKGTDDAQFQEIAENVAHYHHERWDGSGYPEGLKGEEIPLEARIMAIADVYDALVSKRVYKERMSFEKANAIIMDGMGKHFDKSLEKFYVAARPALEAYYRSLEQAEEPQV